jgi:NitT/TauT family transport system substrate-binding protein
MVQVGNGLTRRRFVGRSAGTLAALTGAGGLLASCGGDDDEGSSSGSGSTTGSSTADHGTVQVVNILPPQLGYAAEYIAELDGHFKKEGLTVKVATSRGSAPAIQAILSGTALTGWVGWLESVIGIANREAPIQAIGFLQRGSTLAIVSDKNKPLDDPKDFVGKRVGIPSEGGTSETTLDLLLANNGVDPEQVKRQVTGFTPGTFELIKKGRIAGFVIGGSQQEQFRQTQPDSTFLETSKYVKDGLTYIASKKGVTENKEQLQAYMRALKVSMEQILDDKPAGYPNTLKTLRAKYDFPELKDDKVAKSYLDFNTDLWVKDGREKLLQVDKAEWKATYDDAVKVKAAKAGVDVTQNVVEGITPA